MHYGRGRLKHRGHGLVCIRRRGVGRSLGMKQAPGAFRVRLTVGAWVCGIQGPQDASGIGHLWVQREHPGQVEIVSDPKSVVGRAAKLLDLPHWWPKEWGGGSLTR